MTRHNKNQWDAGHIQVPFISVVLTTHVAFFEYSHKVFKPLSEIHTEAALGSHLAMQKYFALAHRQAIQF